MAVYVFGSNAISQFGLGEDYESTHIPQLIPFFDDKKIKKIKCGSLHTLVITEDNKLYSWGCNDEYALGRDGDEWYPMEVTLPEIPVDITCGSSISACITEKNSLYAWGTFRNGNGVFGFDKNTRIQKKPKKIKGNFGKSKLKNVESGANFICVITKNHEVWTFGSNDFYELGRKTSTRKIESSLFPHRIIKPTRKKDHLIEVVKCGQNHGIVINKINQVFSWGSNVYGQLGTGNDKPTKLRNKIELEDVEDAAGGENHSLFLTKTGDLYGIGRNDQGQLGIKGLEEYFKPEFIISDVTKVRSFENYSICQIGNELYSFGLCFSGATGFEDVELWKPTKIPFDFPKILDFSVGNNFTIVLTQ